MNKDEKEKLTMSEYFDLGLERGALLMDASNLDWFEFPLFSCIRNEIYRILEDPDEDMDWGYSYPGGKNNLRDALAEHESFIEGINISYDDLVVGGNGTTGALNFIAQMIAEENNYKNVEIIYPVPAYAGLEKSLPHYRITPRIIQMNEKNDYKMTLKDVKKAYRKKSVAILITNPANPVCDFIDEDELQKIVDFCIEKNLYIIYDAIFEESPIYNNKRVRIFKMARGYKKLIKIKGFSKDIPQLSDLRCGWTICKDPSVISRLVDLGEITNYSNSTFLEALALVEVKMRNAVDKGDTSEEVLTYVREKNEYHNKIKSTFNEAYHYLNTQKDVVREVCIPDAGNIMYIKLRKDVCNKKGVFTSHDLFVYILEHENILITPANCFGLPNEELAFRITISRSKKQFMDGLRRIVELFKEGC